jgi:G3E family GTPase
MTLTTLVTGASSLIREEAIASAINPVLKTTILLEGFPQGTASLDEFRQRPNINISYVAAGCLCCTGNLVMRVTLNRILRDPPQQLFIALTTADHRNQLKEFLTQPSYSSLLVLTEDLQA